MVIAVQGDAHRRLWLAEQAQLGLGIAGAIHPVELRGRQGRQLLPAQGDGGHVKTTLKPGNSGAARAFAGSCLGSSLALVSL